MRSPEATPDALLARSAAKGDETACRELIRRYQDRIYTVACSYVRDPEEALDITQDAIVRIIEGLPRFRGQSSFYTWLHRIVVNRCLDWRRSRSRRPLPLSLEEVISVGGNEPVDTRRAMQPHHVLETKELREQLTAAIAAVPDVYRTVVVLADVQGLSSAEIAQILDCPVNTVKTRLHRGRVAIRERLREYLQGSD
jgi:RNA polymerase sigma-70 factor, ECF subfamily